MLGDDGIVMNMCSATAEQMLVLPAGYQVLAVQTYVRPRVGLGEVDTKLMRADTVITMETSAKHGLLLDCAMRRAVSGSRRQAFLHRLERSLDQFGSLTDACHD
jgi:hypothetical protein